MWMLFKFFSRMDSKIEARDDWIAFICSLKRKAISIFVE